MFVDGYDVLIDGSSDEILERFDAALSGSPKILFSAESVCGPDKHLAASYPRIDSPYKYLNGGTYMAVASTQRRVMDTHFDMWSKEFVKKDDQREWTRVFLSSQDIVLDTSNAVFNCLVDREQDLVATSRGWYNAATGSYPLVFHGNGPSKHALFARVQPQLRSASG